MCNIKLLHSYSIGIFLINHWVLADVITNSRVVISEPVVIQPILLILILIFKWNEGGIIVAFPLSAEGVKFLLSSLFAIVIKWLQGSIEVVGNEDENLSVGYNLDRHMRRSPTLIAMSPVILF